MIYEPLSPDDDIRQGDIFTDLPFIRFDLEKLKIFVEDKIENVSWIDLLNENVEIFASIKKKYAIVLSQDCDCLRNPFITLSVISEWDRHYESTKKWMLEIIELNKKTPSKMYLPPDENSKISKKMHIDFSQIFHLTSNSLYSFRELRVCRLNPEAMEHFRRKVAYYFRRYAYDEHYPLNSEEFNEYVEWRAKKYPDGKYERRVYQK